MSEKPICTRWSMTLAIEPREYGLMPVSEHEAALKAQGDRLQRAAEHEQQLRWKAEADLVASKSREASPAMLRVVEAAKAYLHEWNIWHTGASRSKLRDGLRAAVDALAAPAVEKARYYVSGNEVRERLAAPENYRTCAAFYGPGHAARAEAECARLNIEDAR